MSIKQHHRGGDYGRGDDPHGVTVNPYSGPQPMPDSYRYFKSKKPSRKDSLSTKPTVHQYYSDSWDDE